jgi:proton-translocating NADH-quinone oxidoreductase chain N
MMFYASFLEGFRLLNVEIFIAISTLALLLFGACYSTSTLKKYPLLIESVASVSLLALSCAFLLTGALPWVKHEHAFSKAFTVDSFTVSFKIIVLLGTLSSLAIATTYLKGKTLQAFEHVTLLLFATLGTLLIISSLDFITLYLSVEIQSLCFYVLAASKRRSEFSIEAGLKYFLLGAFSSTLLIIGISLVYCASGSFNFEIVSHASHQLSIESEGLLIAALKLRLLQLGTFFIAISILFKLHAIPFGVWAPDVYEGTPSAFTALFTIAPKVAFIGVFVKLLCLSFWDLFASLKCLLLFCSLLSLLIGALGSLAQRKVKRLLVYSSMSHVGFILTGLLVGSQCGIVGATLYVFIYAAISTHAFALLLSCTENEGLHSIKYTKDLSFLSQRNKALALSSSVLFISMIGLPPFIGFVGKFAVFQSAMLDTSLLPFVLLALISSVLTCFYYLRLIKIVHFSTLNARTALTLQAVGREKATLLGITFCFLLFGFWSPESLISWVETVVYLYFN